jgi:gliding motility-associated-like protein
LFFGTFTAGGNYYLHWRNGSDGNTLSDPCDNYVPFDSMRLYVYPPMDVIVTKDRDEICDGGDIVILNQTTIPAAYTINSYNWFDNNSPLSTNEDLGSPILNGGTHAITLQINTLQCGIFSDYTNVQVWNYPKFTLPDTYIICPDNNYQLTAFADFEFVTYNWNNGSTQSITSYTSQYPYATCLADIKGCSWTDTMRIISNCNFNIPNAFTPNNDGLNDLFYPIVDPDIKGIFRIYSRWGEKVFETTDLNQGWDGTFKGQDCQPGVFVHYLYIYDIANSTDIIKGNVTLIR